MVGLLAQGEELVQRRFEPVFGDVDMGANQQEHEALVHVCFVNGDGGEPLLRRADAPRPHLREGHDGKEEVGLGQMKDLGVGTLPAEEELHRLFVATVVHHDVGEVGGDEEGGGPVLLARVDLEGAVEELGCGDVAAGAGMLAGDVVEDAGADNGELVSEHPEPLVVPDQCRGEVALGGEDAPRRYRGGSDDVGGELADALQDGVEEPFGEFKVAHEEGGRHPDEIAADDPIRWQLERHEPWLELGGADATGHESVSAADDLSDTCRHFVGGERIEQFDGQRRARDHELR